MCPINVKERAEGIAEIPEKHPKEKEILRKGPAPLLKISLWDSFQFLLMQINHWVSTNGFLQTINGLKRLMGNFKRLH